MADASTSTSTSTSTSAASNDGSPSPLLSASTSTSTSTSAAGNDGSPPPLLSASTSTSTSAAGDDGSPPPLLSASTSTSASAAGNDGSPPPLLSASTSTDTSTSTSATGNDGSPPPLLLADPSTSASTSVASNDGSPPPLLSPSVVADAATSTSAEGNDVSPSLLPVAKKVKHEMELFGDVRFDNYYWLRDLSLSDPEVQSYLIQENAYTEYSMSGTKQLEDQIYAEIRGRIQEDDISAPIRRGPFYYYKRTLEGKEYVQHCRRLAPDDGAPLTVYDTMQTGPDAPPEHVILDENIKAQEHAYYSLDAFEISPNNKLVAYAEDIKGEGIYSVHVIDVGSGAPYSTPLHGTTKHIAWAGDESLVYITKDENGRPDQVLLHKLGTEQSSDTCLYHEKDEKFCLQLVASESKKFLFIASESHQTTSFEFYLDISKPENELTSLTPRLDGVDTSSSHCGSHFIIRRRSDECFNSELLACAIDNTSATSVLLPHRPSVKIQEIRVFKDHLVVHERENGLPMITVYLLPDFGEPLQMLQGGQAVSFIDQLYSVVPWESQFSSSILRFDYSSMCTPPSVYDYDLNSGTKVLKKIETVLGGFDASNYITEREWATASDGTEVPISIVFEKNTVKLDGTDPLLLGAHGSYEVCIDTYFKAEMLPLLDRGFMFATARVRGGGEMGRQWYENGRLLQKKNTFTDFIACAEHLIEKKYCTNENLCIDGRNAGGLIIAVVLNMRPDLFRAVVAEVPFVDILTTMLDPTTPLTKLEWEEWGDPSQEEFYFYMKSYSPLDNIRAQNYPAILVTAGPNDTYAERAKYVAKLRDTKTDNNLLLFKCEPDAGHHPKPRRLEKLHEYAFIITFLLKALDMVPTLDEAQY